MTGTGPVDLQGVDGPVGAAGQHCGVVVVLPGGPVSDVGVCDPVGVVVRDGVVVGDSVGVVVSSGPTRAGAPDVGVGSSQRPVSGSCGPPGTPVGRGGMVITVPLGSGTPGIGRPGFTQIGGRAVGAPVPRGVDPPLTDGQV